MSILLADQKNNGTDLKEIASGVWMQEGFLGNDFFGKPPSSNVYFLKDGETLFILDTGHGSPSRENILSFIEKMKNEGIKRLILMVTQGHFDHSGNNDLLMETGLDWEFLLPEPEIPVIDVLNDVMKDIENLQEYEDIFRTMFPLKGKTAIIRIMGMFSPGLAKYILRKVFKKQFSKCHTIAERACPLKIEECITMKIGSVSLRGWNVGRFFIIHDGAHSPGHICLYDPENKLLLCGDVTVEVNPAFFYSSINKLIEAIEQFIIMAEEGLIEIIGDSHRTRKYFTILSKQLGFQMLDDIQLIDYVTGKDECIKFFSTFKLYYQQLKQEVLTAHVRVGRATIDDIVKELAASSNPAIKLKAAMTFPQLPSRMDVLVASVLREAGAIPVKEGRKIVIDPVLSKTH
jgi:glyoxylase-like metal-dependent hydrolase (beta-lactamase superfamily II)